MISNLPRVRWLALLLAIAFGVVFAGVKFDVAAALGNLGTKGAAVAALLMALAKIVEEVMRTIDADDPIVEAEDYHTMSRGVDLPPFWRRVL